MIAQAYKRLVQLTRGIWWHRSRMNACCEQAHGEGVTMSETK
jgi:hypothetical protein